MKNKKYCPMLAPNETVNLNTIKYPLMVSTKLDGIRCIFYKGEILSRSLKQIQNKQIREKFEPIRKYSEEHQCILDGELFSSELTLQQITGFVMSHDLTDKKSIKRYGSIVEIPAHLNFYCFDIIGINEDSTPALDVEFQKRLGCMALDISEYNLTDVVIPVKHTWVNTKEEVETLFEKALEDGEEGLILRDPKGRYKCGRGTIKEGLIYKVKPFRTFDAQIIGVVQATTVNPDAEKTINELGRSVTSKRKQDRELVEKASAFKVLYEEKEVKVVIAMTDEEKKTIWENKDSYIRKTIEYKGMLVGAKDVPRHPVMLRFREDK